jgi:hypothetical protein
MVSWCVEAHFSIPLRLTFKIPPPSICCRNWPSTRHMRTSILLRFEDLSCTLSALLYILSKRDDMHQGISCPNECATMKIRFGSSVGCARSFSRGTENAQGEGSAQSGQIGWGALELIESTPTWSPGRENHATSAAAYRGQSLFDHDEEAVLEKVISEGIQCSRRRWTQ